MSAPTVYSAITAVAADLATKGVPKNQTNAEEQYQFRGIDDLYNRLSPVLAAHKLCILPRVLERSSVERHGTNGVLLVSVTLKVAFDTTAERLMPRLALPKMRVRPRTSAERRSFPAHRAWVRRHHCSVPGCEQLPIECAHVRRGTDGGKGLKPSDRWTLSLCRNHHAEQHRIGEAGFEKRYEIDLLELATAFAVRSPHRHLWSSGCQ